MQPYTESPGALMSLLRRIRHLVRREDDLVIEAAPLHTERLEWAAQAPAQIEAAFARGAAVIAFTELGSTHKALRAQLPELAAQAGYVFFFPATDDSAMAYRADLPNASAGEFPVPGSTTKFISFVDFDFHGRRVRVHGMHWMTLGGDRLAVRVAQTEAIIAAMQAASKGSRLSFVMADSNPTRALSDPNGEPRHSLNEAGLLLVNEELDQWPVGLGVTLVARNSADIAVTAKSAVLSDALGSDHQPLTVTYSVKRPRR